MRLPIGYDVFQDVILNKLDFVDKTLFIKDIIDDPTQVILITRPRRFGKTLNLSMLQHFFAKEVYGQETNTLFETFNIVTEHPYWEQQGKYPVIFLTFKNIKEESYENTFSAFSRLIEKTYSEHAYLLESECLNARQKKSYSDILDKKASKEDYELALQDLTHYLFLHYGTKAVVLIDEYDTPIQAGFLCGYYEGVVKLIRKVFGATFKTNPYLYKAVLSGILRISKESLFSGLNNVKVYSIFNTRYNDYFGFTEQEVSSLFLRSGLNTALQEVTRWYNGYRIGDLIIYNPWSIANCIQENGNLKPYWVNTSDNALIRDIMLKSSAHFKEQFEQLLQGGTIESLIDENVVFEDLKKNESAGWSLLLMTGYLKIVVHQQTDQGLLCQLALPNQEVRNLYRSIIENWLAGGQGISWYNQFLESLLKGEMEKFEAYLHFILLNSISVHDGAKEPEAFYHGLMLGLIASLDQNFYQVKSNREAGLGRYDIAIIPKVNPGLAIIIELKSIKNIKETQDSTQTLEGLMEKAANEALEQINMLQYATELENTHHTILKIGIVFSGKKFKLKSQSS